MDNNDYIIERRSLGDVGNSNIQKYPVQSKYILQVLISSMAAQWLP